MVWREAAAGRKVSEVTVRREVDGNWRVLVSLAYPPQATVGTLIYTLHQRRTDPRGVSDRAPRARAVGAAADRHDRAIPAAYDRVAWLGRGPHESYTDRRDSSLFGRYELPADDLFFPYVEPQETGNRTEVFWATFTDARAEASGCGAIPSSTSVSCLTQRKSLKRANIQGTQPRGNRVLRLDYGQMGLAGENSWGARPGPNTTPAGRAHQYGFVLEPVYGP